MGYEIYSRQTVRVSTPMITLNSRGRLVFNVAATKILHDAGVETVFLMWDSQSRKFAVKPTSKRDLRTLNVRYSGEGKWAAISAKGFLVHIGHDTSTTRAYPASWNANENMFEVSMVQEPEESQKVPEIQSARVRSTASKQATIAKQAMR